MTVCSSSQDFCSQMHLLHTSFPCRWTHPLQFKNCGQFPWVLGPASPPGGLESLSDWQVTISSASASCTWLPSRPFLANSFYPSWYFLVSILTFFPWTESLFWTFLIVCQELPVSSRSQGALLLVDHCLFSLHNLTNCAEECWDRVTRMARGASDCLYLKTKLSLHWADLLKVLHR